MYCYKDFIYQITKLSMQEPYIILVNNIVPFIKNSVEKLSNLKHVGEAHHKYYGEVKQLLCNFLVNFSWKIDNVFKEVDKYKHGLHKNSLLTLLDESISLHTENHIAFGKEFLPVKSPEEKKKYQEIEETFDVFMNKMRELKDYIQRSEKQECIDQFVKERLELTTIKITSELFHYTHFYISMMLVDRINHIRVSLEEIHKRMKNNLKKLQDDFEDIQSEMILKLYNKNKEKLHLIRQEGRFSVQNAEVSRCIQTLRNKIQNLETDSVYKRLAEEVKYWDDRVKEFHVVYSNLQKIKSELEKVEQEEKVYNSMKNVDIPGSKHQCWMDMGKTLAERKKRLMDLEMSECKTLLTFFIARGYDRIYYTDNVGTYFMDEFKHRIYKTAGGLGTDHVNCKGEFVNFPDRPYYFDLNGRYVIEDGRRIYKAALCTSEYDLSADQTFKKITKDCGHSERHNAACKLEVTDPNQFEILPDVKPVDFKNSVDSEMIKYLWDKFGHILPEALYDVCIKQPNNPIHYLAHRLIHYKYTQSPKQLEKKFKEAQAYRASVYKERRDKAVAASKAWKAKQWKASKPEDLDDTQDRAAYDVHQAQQDFIHLLNIFYQ